MKTTKYVAGVASIAVAFALAVAGCSSGTASNTTSSANSPGTSSAGGSSSGETSAPASLQNVTLQLNWIRNATWAGSFTAQHDGLYKAAGLNVTIETGGPNVDYMAALSAGKALVAFAGFNDVVTLNEKGANMRVVGTMYQRNPIAIISKAGSGIDNPKSLEGKRLGLGTSSLLNWQQFARMNKVDESKVKIINTDDGLSALVSGQVDAYMGYATEAPSLLAAKGIDSNYFVLQDFGFGYYVDVYAVRQEDLKDPTKRDEIKRLLKSDLEGQVAAISDPEAAGKLTVDLYGKELGLDVKSQVDNVRAAAPFFCSPTTKEHGIGYIGGDTLKTAIETVNLTTGSTLPTENPDVVDMSLLDEIHADNPDFGKIPSGVCG